MLMGALGIGFGTFAMLFIKEPKNQIEEPEPKKVESKKEVVATSNEEKKNPL